jgi:hypothetical protein
VPAYCVPVWSAVMMSLSILRFSTARVVICMMAAPSPCEA